MVTYDNLSVQRTEPEVTNQLIERDELSLLVWFIF